MISTIKIENQLKALETIAEYYKKWEALFLSTYTREIYRRLQNFEKLEQNEYKWFKSNREKIAELVDAGRDMFVEFIRSDNYGWDILGVLLSNCLFDIYFINFCTQAVGFAMMKMLGKDYFNAHV